MAVVSVPPRCIVTDLDRTLTGPDLVLHPAALARIRALRAEGFKLVVATGRRFDDPHVARLLRDLDGLVAENGAVVCLPHRNSVDVSHPEFGRAARAALGPLAERFRWGLVVGSGPRELSGDATTRLAQHGVDHTVEFNAEEAMLLPPGVDKTTGAEACLREWGLTAESVWGIGDGENDVALLKWAGVGAAPANGVASALAVADVLMAASYAQAFLELTDPLVPPGSERPPLTGGAVPEA